jgi:AraC-like DNA-binding protein
MDTALALQGFHQGIQAGSGLARNAPPEQGFPVGTLSELPALMREFGHDSWELLESFGVTPEVMSKPLTLLPVRTLGAILLAAAKATGRESLGLLLGQRANLENVGPLRLLVFNARTGREAIEGLVRYASLWYRGLKLDLEFQKGYAQLSVSAEADFPGRDALLTAYVAATVKHLESILGRAWRPSQIHIAYRKPKSAEFYSRFFRAPVLFNQPRHAVLFAEAVLDAPRASSDRNLDAFLRQYLADLEAREQPDFVARVRQVIGNLLASGDCNLERVAGIFSIHRVTLHRYLREEETSFEALLDESRREMAERMLTSSDQPIADIATALGYGAAGSFVRAFVRWHGTTPGAWRTRRPAARRVSASARRRK